MAALFVADCIWNLNFSKSGMFFNEGLSNFSLADTRIFCQFVVGSLLNIEQL